MIDRTTQYPAHLAKLVAGRLRTDQVNSPPESVLTRLLETLYFASLKTDEGRPILCTVNYVDPDARDNQPPSRCPADCWSHVPFERPLPFDVRTLTKLARAADPAPTARNWSATRTGPNGMPQSIGGPMNSCPYVPPSIAGPSGWTPSGGRSPRPGLRGKRPRKRPPRCSACRAPTC